MAPREKNLYQLLLAGHYHVNGAVAQARMTMPTDRLVVAIESALGISVGDKLNMCIAGL